MDFTLLLILSCCGNDLSQHETMSQHGRDTTTFNRKHKDEYHQRDAEKASATCNPPSKVKEVFHVTSVMLHLL